MASKKMKQFRTKSVDVLEALRGIPVARVHSSPAPSKQLSGEVVDNAEASSIEGVATVEQGITEGIGKGQVTGMSIGETKGQAIDQAKGTTRDHDKAAEQGTDIGIEKQPDIGHEQAPAQATDSGMDIGIEKGQHIGLSKGQEEAVVMGHVKGLEEGNETARLKANEQGTAQALSQEAHHVKSQGRDKDIETGQVSGILQGPPIDDSKELMKATPKGIAIGMSKDPSEGIVKDTDKGMDIGLDVGQEQVPTTVISEDLSIGEVDRGDTAPEAVVTRDAGMVDTGEEKPIVVGALGNKAIVLRTYLLHQRQLRILDEFRDHGFRKSHIVKAAIESMVLQMDNGTWKEIPRDHAVDAKKHGNPVLQELLLRKSVADERREAVSRTFRLPFSTIQKLEEATVWRRQLGEQFAKEDYSSTLRIAIDRFYEQYKSTLLSQ